MELTKHVQRGLGSDPTALMNGDIAHFSDRISLRCNLGTHRGSEAAVTDSSRQVRLVGGRQPLQIEDPDHDLLDNAPRIEDARSRVAAPRYASARAQSSLRVTARV
jgi:hypothetical protein